jgi:hypothetical protein
MICYVDTKLIRPSKTGVLRENTRKAKNSSSTNLKLN